ncbi:unnamed protein product [Ectocarpus sp. 4 AP-2014]
MPRVGQKLKFPMWDGKGAREARALVTHGLQRVAQPRHANGLSSLLQVGVTVSPVLLFATENEAGGLRAARVEERLGTSESVYVESPNAKCVRAVNTVK